jgi:hypothetical protein
MFLDLDPTPEGPCGVSRRLLVHIYSNYGPVGTYKDSNNEKARL